MTSFVVTTMNCIYKAFKHFEWYVNFVKIQINYENTTCDKIIFESIGLSI